MEQSTKNVLWISGGLLVAAGVGFVAWKYLMPKNPKPIADKTVDADSSTPVGAWAENPKPTGTPAPKLPSDWKTFQLRFPDGVPFIAKINATHLNIQIPAISVNKSFAMTANEKTSINLNLSKGTPIEAAIFFLMKGRGLDSALKVKNAK